MSSGGFLSDMRMCFEVFGTITARSEALSAVTEIHIGIRFIRDSTNGTAMKEVFFRGSAKFLGLEFHSPASGSNRIQDFPSEKQKEVNNRSKHKHPGRPVTKNKNE
jgi:hypothetical protein